MPRRRAAAPLEHDQEIVPAKEKTLSKKIKAPIKKIVVKTVKRPSSSARRKTVKAARASEHEEKITAYAVPPPQRTQVPSEPRKVVRNMTAIECFVYGGIVCLVGTIGLGLLLGLVVLPPIVQKYEQSQYSYAAPALSSDPAALQLPSTSDQTEELPDQTEYGFYGTLLSKEEGVLMVQELLPPLPLEEQSKKSQTAAKTYVVRVSQNTEYTYQRPRDKNNITDPLFSPESGSLDAVKKDMFVFVNTLDDPQTTDTIQAQHILYSELSPFAE